MHLGAGQMAGWLRHIIALAQNSTSVSGVNVLWLKTTSNYNSGDLMPSNGLQRHYTRTVEGLVANHIPSMPFTAVPPSSVPLMGPKPVSMGQYKLHKPLFYSN